MTEHEASKIRSGFSNGFHYPFGGGDIEKCDMEEANRHAELLDEALKKQIPQKPIELSDSTGSAKVICCCGCKSPIVNVWSKKYKPKYCHYCGQALDWVCVK